MTRGQIPFTAVDRYAARHGLDDEFEAFRRAIRAMDATYLAFHAEAQPGGGQGKAEPTVSPRPLSVELFDALF